MSVRATNTSRARALYDNEGASLLQAHQHVQIAISPSGVLLGYLDAVAHITPEGLVASARVVSLERLATFVVVSARAREVFVARTDMLGRGLTAGFTPLFAPVLAVRLRRPPPPVLIATVAVAS